MKKQLLNNEFCPEDWGNMEQTPKGRFCDKCSVDLPDLSEKSIEEIVKNHIGRGKCVQLNNTQLDFLSFYQKLGKSIITSSFVLSASLSNMTFAHTSELDNSNTDSCIVRGRVDFNSVRFYESNNLIVFVIEGKTYETRTDQKGKFEITLPKGAQVEYTNINDLRSKTISKRSRMNLRKVHIPAQRRMIGWL